MKISLSRFTLLCVSTCLTGGTAVNAADEQAKDLGSYSVGERRSTIQTEEFKVERPKFENNFKMEPSKPSFGGMQFAKPKLEILSGPDDQGNDAGNGPIASADTSRQTQAPAGTGGETRSVQPLRMDPPSYPRDALRRRQEGYVVIEFTVNASGRTEDISIAEADPRNAFEREARRAVEGWQFEPALRDGRPIPQRIRHTLEFTLEGQ